MHMNTNFIRRAKIGLQRYTGTEVLHLSFSVESIMLGQSEMLFSVGDILNTLTNVSGRKHPSTVQAKQLKMCLPMMPVVLHLVTSQVDFFSQTPSVSENLISAD